MSQARAVWKAICKQRRAEKRAVENAARTEKRNIEKRIKQTRKAAERESAKAAAHAAKDAAKRPRGRPPKPPPRPARWTRYSREHPRVIYHAIKEGRCFSDDASVGDYFGVCSLTAKNWCERHPGFARAIMRGYEDRAAIRSAILSCARVEYNFTRINERAKTDRGRFAKVIQAAKPIFDFDRHGQLVEDGHLMHQPRRRWRDRPPPGKHHLNGLLPEHRRKEASRAQEPAYIALAVAAVEDGARSNRQLAARLHVAESTIRYWRQKHPGFDAAIGDALTRT